MPNDDGNNGHVGGIIILKLLRPGRDRFQTGGPGKLLLAPVEGDEGAEPELQRRGDMEHIESTAPARRRV